MNPLNLLPEDVQCPNCGVELKLSEEERTRRQFTCSVCRESFTVKPDAMYCPQCGAEYRPEIIECSDCRVPLVETLTEEAPEQEPDKYVEIMSTFNAADMAVIKSILDMEKIAYYLHDENFHAIYPAIQPVKIFVREDQVETAIELLQVLDSQVTTSSQTTEEGDDEISGRKE
ncbi:DUF2007 domain-containing protein [candidate division KSB1 bacterium]|nr:DUF2007 domain-containing protein [candidate division KSB1 bacterium]